MPLSSLIGVRHVSFAGTSIAVVLTRNASGTVSGECLLAPTERPIIDGPTVAEVLGTVERVIEALLLARSQKGR